MNEWNEWNSVVRLRLDDDDDDDADDKNHHK